MNREVEYLHPVEFFFTFDLGLACALVTLEYRLHAIDKNNPSKAEFIFKRRDGLDEDVTKYWSKKLPADLRSYFDNLKMLKNQLFSS